MPSCTNFSLSIVIFGTVYIKKNKMAFELGWEDILKHGKLSSHKAKLIPIAIGTSIFLSGLYRSIAKRSLDPTTQEDVLIGDAVVDTLHEDRELLFTFKKLYEMTFESNREYLYNAVENTDRLVFLHNQILSKKINPTTQDRISCFVYYKKSQTYLKQLELNACKQQVTHPKNAVMTEIFVNRIIQKLQDYWMSVMRMTSEVYES